MSRLSTERVGVGLAAALTAIAPLAVFAPVLGNGVLKWDDHYFVGPEAHLGWGWDGLRGAFAELHLGQFVPLPWLTLVLDRRVWGGLDGGYHLTNVLWHAAAGLLWFSFWLRLLTRPGSTVRRGDAALAAAIASLLFTVHPLRVESVAWLAERRDVLCGFFYVAALRLYLESCLGNARWRAGALACFALSLLSKAAALTLPATLLILDVYPLKRFSRGAVLEKLPFAALSVACTGATLVTLKHARMVDAMADLSALQRLTCAAYSLLFYVRKEFWPFPMLPFYPLPRPFEPFSPRFLGWSAAAVAAVFAARRLSRGRPALGAACVHYAAALLPVSGLIGAGLAHLGTDRFSYFPNLAFSALAAAAMARLLPSRRFRAPALAAAALILAALGVASWNRCKDWRDDETLWRAALSVDPDNREARYDIAAALAEKGRPVEAAAAAEERTRWDGESWIAWENLGAARLALEQWAGAESAYRKAVALNPDDAAAKRGLGRSLAGEGRGAEAADQLRAAAALDPEDAVVRYELGNALLRLGRRDPAGDAYLDALRLDPSMPEAHANLGRLLELQGLPDAAVEEYRAAARSGRSPEGVYNWGNIESRNGRGEVAIRLYREALRERPDFDDARVNLAHALARAGRPR
jgi:tetratricopeptide (TPR) repeat protein